MYINSIWLGKVTKEVLLQNYTLYYFKDHMKAKLTENGVRYIAVDFKLPMTTLLTWLKLMFLSLITQVWKLISYVDEPHNTI